MIKVTSYKLSSVGEFKQAYINPSKILTIEDTNDANYVYLYLKGDKLQLAREELTKLKGLNDMVEYQCAINHNTYFTFVKEHITDIVVCDDWDIVTMEDGSFYRITKGQINYEEM
jgi:hypothetical protein